MAVWEVEVTDQFLDWWRRLSEVQQVAMSSRVDLLAERGPDLGRPVVDRIQTSRHHNMKELRAARGGALRVLFMFDPRRQASSCWGATRPWNDWYETAVPTADDLYDAYLEELKMEGLI